MDEIEKLQRGMAELEAKRAELGDGIVDATLGPLAKRLAELKGGYHGLDSARKRFVSVLFADIAGSTALTLGLDPEDGQEFLDGALRLFSSVVQRHGGLVARYQGDGLKAVFGLPQVGEDDAERAVLAGLGMQAAARAYARSARERWGIEDFRARIGIASGPAVIGAGLEDASDVGGAVVNLAARLESAAPPGGILVSAATHELVKDLFVVEPAEPFRAKGFQEEIRAYRVEASGTRPLRRLGRGPDGELTPLIGRRTELAAIRATLEAAATGCGPRAIALIGEAGTGKSRLIAELADSGPEGPWNVFRARCEPGTAYRPYALAKRLLAGRFGIADSDPAPAAAEKIADGMAALGQDEPLMRAHFVAALIGYALRDSPWTAARGVDPIQVRDRGVAYFADLVAAAASGGRRAWIELEDLHWADAESLEALRQAWVAAATGPAGNGSALFLVCAGRPEFLHRFPQALLDWGAAERIDLGPLDAADCRALAGAAHSGPRELPERLMDAIVSAAGGNPLYVEELVRSLPETGILAEDPEDWAAQEPRLDAFAVPGTLMGLLQSRIDALLKRERDVLERASVIGSVFWDRAVERLGSDGAAPGPGERAGENLERLCGRGLISASLGSAFAGTEEFLFRHELLRDAVYGTIIKGERRGYHSRAARWYAAFAADGNDEYLAIIAGHYRLAGEDGPCLDYTKLAIARYARRFCGRAVIELAAKALPLARSDSEALELLRPKAEAHIDLGDYAGAAACLDSVEALGEIPAEAADWLVLKRLILFQRRGEQLAGLEFAHGQAARLGAIGDPASKAKYFNNLGLMLASLGRSAEAESNFRLAARWGAGGIDEAHAYNNLGNLRYSGGAYEEALEFHQMARDAYLAEGNPRNLGVSFNNIGVAYDCLQRPDEALAAYEAGLAHSAAAGDLNNLSNLLSNLDMIYFDRGMNAKALALESQSLALRRRIGNAYGIAISLANMAAIERGEGLDGAALAKYREAAEILERTGGLDIIDYVYLPIMAAALDAGDGPLFLDFQEKFFSRPGRGDLDSAAGYALALMADGLRPRDGFAGPARAGLAFLMRQGLPVEVEALFEAGKTALSQDEEWAFDALEREIAWLEGQGRGEGARAAAAAYLDRARASGKPRLIGRAERFIGERP